MSLHSPAARPDYPEAGEAGALAVPLETAGPREGLGVLLDSAGSRAAHRLLAGRTHATGSKTHAPTSSQRDQGRRPNVALMEAAQSFEATPTIFTAVTEALRASLPRLRPDISIHEVTAPGRLAPHAFALAGELAGDAADSAAGRLVLLMDPAGQPAWQGSARLVCYARASIDPEIAADPMLAEVAWSWLREALDGHGASVRALGGTVTATSSRRFGVLRAEGDTQDVELRCSWSPDWAETALDPGPSGPAGYGAAEVNRRPRLAWTPAAATAHLLAFADLLAAMAGLPPALSGVIPLTQRRA